jgi:His-Xaa-Ser system radical SAM maturase HxsB
MKKRNDNYLLLPFFFTTFGNSKKMLLTNDVGDFTVMPDHDFQSLVKGTIPTGSQVFKNLQSSFLCMPEHLRDTVDLLATRYRTKKRFLYDFTTLHMMVLTKRCNQRCRYCHASSLSADSGSSADMELSTAKKCIDTILAMPSKNVKIEFQGGEPTLNADVLRGAVEYALVQNKTLNKRIDFVVCTNLLSISDDLLRFFKDNNIQVSMSLDGPESLHDTCRRTCADEATHKQVCQNLERAKMLIDKRNISALMTVTRYNLFSLRLVVDEYIRLGFNSIFIRPLNPFGFAVKNWSELGYTTEEFFCEYKSVIQYLLEINRKGHFFPELYAGILLSRILTPFSTGFVDLQSPAGVGIQGVIYDTNGDVLVSDEARMFRNMTGSEYFTIGNIHVSSWQEIFGSEKLRSIIRKSCIESLPHCAWCVYQPFCGSDPVREYAQYGDIMSFKPVSDFCQRQKLMFGLFMDMLAGDNQETIDDLWSWVTNQPCIKIDG